MVISANLPLALPPLCIGISQPRCTHISHHWNDGTHITFGVVTLGYRYDKFKLETSIFNGSEPDENRFDFDKPLFNSYSGRLSYNPNLSGIDENVIL